METITSNQGQSGWLRRWRAFGMTFAVAKGCGVKAKWTKRKGCSADKSINGQRKTNLMANAHKKKQRIYEKQGGCCALCGKPMLADQLQLHHILPLHYFPEVGAAEGNLMLVCDPCHHHIHMNPLLMADLMRGKAQELGVSDLDERYRKFAR